MELTTDVNFLVLSSVNNNLFLYVLATSMICEIRYVGTGKLKNIPYINLRLSGRSISVLKQPGYSNERFGCSVSWRGANI